MFSRAAGLFLCEGLASRGPDAGWGPLLSSLRATLCINAIQSLEPLACIRYSVPRRSIVARKNKVSEAIYRHHIRLFRFLNDAWIFTTLIGPLLKEKGDALIASKSKA